MTYSGEGACDIFRGVLCDIFRGGDVWHIQGVFCDIFREESVTYIVRIIV